MHNDTRVPYDQALVFGLMGVRLVDLSTPALWGGLLQQPRWLEYRLDDDDDDDEEAMSDSQGFVIGASITSVVGHHIM